MTKINPTPVFVQPKVLVNPANLRDGLGWFIHGIAAHARGEPLTEKVLKVVREAIFAMREANIFLPDERHSIKRGYKYETFALSLIHPYGFKITLLSDYRKNDRIIINDDVGNPLTLSPMYK